MSLVLSRRPQEIIHIGPDITVRVVRIVGNQVQLAIEAPRDVVVDRAEIRARREAEKVAP